MTKNELIKIGMANRRARGHKLGRPHKYYPVEIKALKLSGMRNIDIARRLNCTPQTVYRTLRKLKK